MKIQSSKSAGRKAAMFPPDKRIEMIEVAAYYRAEHRAFNGSSTLDDWLEAEEEVDRLLQAKSAEKSSAKQFFQQKLEAQIREWDQQLDELKARTPELTGKVRAEYDKQLESLLQNMTSARQRLEDLRLRTEDAWEDLKDGTEKALAEMRKSMDRIASRFK